MEKARTVFPSLPRLFSRQSVLPLALLLACTSVQALESLDDAAMSDESGAGIVYGLDDFSFRMAPTSYIEATGTAASSAAAAVGWKQGDARYYGLSFTYGGQCNIGTGPGTGKACTGGAASAGLDWFGNSSASVASGSELSYPLGKKASPGTTNPYGVVGFASVYNPYILRVYQYPGYNYAGTYLNAASGANAMPTIVEFVGPSRTDPWRWSFWGELAIKQDGTTWATSTSTSGFDIGGGVLAGGTYPGCLAAGNGNTSFCGLQSQTIILGSPTASGQVWLGGTTFSSVPAQRRPAVLRLMQSTNTSDQTFAVTYQSAISGDLRFTVQQTSAPASPNILHVVPSFSTTEGLYFKNVDAFLPLGSLHAQSLTVSGSAAYCTRASAGCATGTPAGEVITNTSYIQNGNYVLELARIPNTTNVYNNIYCGQTTGVVCTGVINVPACSGTGTGTTNCSDGGSHPAQTCTNWTMCTTLAFLNQGAAVTWTAGPSDTNADGYIDAASINSNTHGYVRWGNWTTTEGGTAQIVTSGATGTGAYSLPSGTSTANGIYFSDGAATPVITNIGISRVENLMIQHLKITTLGAGS